MASMMRIWLSVWVISDLMVFEMNATQNSTHEINSNNNNVREITVSSIVNDESPEIDLPGIILNLYDPDDHHDSKEKNEHTNNSSEQTEPTKQPFMQFELEHPDKNKRRVHDHSYVTTTPASSSAANCTRTTKKPLIPAATAKPSIKHKKDSQQKIIISSVPDCPPLEDADSISQTELIKRLVHVCRFDRLERPVSYDSNNQRKPVQVHARAFVYFMQNLDVHDLKFDVHLLFQVRYVDPRLVFKELSPNRKQPIVGGTILRKALWSPHIFMANARASDILGTTEKDILSSVSPDGTVIISSRIRASVNCWMNLQMYPFDAQKCNTIFESWMYNSSELELHWEEASPITIAPELRLTEYELVNMWTNETVVHANLNNLRHGAFTGNYSSLSFTLHLYREMGCFFMDYFLPSIMIVMISWVSFWLRADSAPRITLGTSTMLTFITLSSTRSRTLPKVSYIKMSEVWFVVCCLFIFSSLVEFAIVNSIFRRDNKVNLKKVNAMYILKASLTPQLKRKNVSNGSVSVSSSALAESTCSNRKAKKRNINNNKSKEKQHLTIHYSNHESIPTITTTHYIDDVTQNSLIDIDPTPKPNNDSIDPKHGCTTMTSQEISLWIDRRARILFPSAFIVFNIVYWAAAYIV